MTDIIDTLKEGETLAPSEEQTRHLVNYIAILVRATRSEYGLNNEQRAHIIKLFEAIYKAHPEITGPITDALHEYDRNGTKTFWQTPSDDVLNALHSSGILVDSLGLPKE